ncbi:MAG: CaiB/BaiF CoA transferase family protein [Dehalococcoidia bacterium]
MDSALGDIRVIDASGAIGHYAGYLLADLGADVIKLEPPGGDPLRAWPPLLSAGPEGETGLPFLLLNVNKRGVVLDLADGEERATFRRLLAGADVLIESWSPSEAADLGFAPDAIREAYPSLIHVSVTPWGLSGPAAGQPSSDLVAQAESGVVNLSGFPDAPPRKLPDLQGYRCASINAAAGAMAALLHRDLTGRGQLVEVSMHESLLIAQETAMQQADILGTNRQRLGVMRPGGFKMPGLGLYEAADGYIFTMSSGTAGAGFAGLADLIEELDGPGPLNDEPLATFARERMNAGILATQMLDPAQAAALGPTLVAIEEIVAAFFRRHPKELLYERGQDRRVLIGAVNTPAEISGDAQLAARDWFREVEDTARGQRLRYPGPAWFFELMPAVLQRPAPRLGEHTREVLDELGTVR